MLYTTYKWPIINDKGNCFYLFFKCEFDLKIIKKKFYDRKIKCFNNFINKKALTS